MSVKVGVSVPRDREEFVEVKECRVIQLGVISVQMIQCVCVNILFQDASMTEMIGVINKNLHFYNRV